MCSSSTLYYVTISHADFGLAYAYKEPRVISVVYSQRVLAERPTNGAMRHSGHILADKTHSQSINILQNSHLGKTTTHCLELSVCMHKIPNKLT